MLNDRLWNHSLLVKDAKIFEICPFESIIYEKQIEYYDALRKSDKAGNCSVFVEFCLEAISKSLEDVFYKLTPKRTSPQERVSKALVKFGKGSFSRKDYMSIHPSISTATASRDLATAVVENRLLLRGEKSKATYCFRS